MDDWRAELARLAGAEKRPERPQRQGGITPDVIERQFLRRMGMGALREIGDQLEDLGRKVELALREAPSRVSMVVYYEDREEFRYTLRVRRRADRGFAYCESSYQSRINRRRYTYECYIGGHQLDHTIDKVTREEIITSFLDEYRHVCAERRG